MHSGFLSDLLDNLSESVYVQDKDGNVIYANSDTVQIFGISRAEVLSFNTYELAKVGMINVHMLEEVLRTKATVTACQTYYTPAFPEGKDMLVTQRPILDENGELKYSVGVIRDMKKLDQAYEECKKIEGYKIVIDSPQAPPPFVYQSAEITELLQSSLRVSNSDAAVLIFGESGVGKEIMAEYIHQNSNRSNREMIRINCAALPENLLEAELFGYEKGAFTGALAGGKKGLIEAADHSTLFLDEINSIPLSLQGKLLRVLETKMVRRIGSNNSNYVDFRLITATNEDLLQLAEEKRFRMDLYYRCNVLSFTVPPLRERKDDLRPLCRYFLEQYNHKYGRYKSFSDALLQRMEDYDWPGNVRELKNFVERAVLMTENTVERIDDVPEQWLQGIEVHREPPVRVPRSREIAPLMHYDRSRSLKENTADYERWLIEQAIADCGSLTKAAKHLGVDKTTLIRKRKGGQS